jgi:hypothetical protein
MARLEISTTAQQRRLTLCIQSADDVKGQSAFFAFEPLTCQVCPPLEILETTEHRAPLCIAWVCDLELHADMQAGSLVSAAHKRIHKSPSMF